MGSTAYAHRIEGLLATARCEPVTLTDKDVWAWQTEWRRAYAGQLHAETGNWIHKEFDWHVFTFGKCPHKNGDRARTAYRRVEPGPFLVLSAYTQVTFGFTCNGQPPDELDCGIDILVAPPTMEWTMAFTHDRRGPLPRGISLSPSRRSRDYDRDSSSPGLASPAHRLRT